MEKQKLIIVHMVLSLTHNHCFYETRYKIFVIAYIVTSPALFHLEVLSSYFTLHVTVKPIFV